LAGAFLATTFLAGAFAATAFLATAFFAGAFLAAGLAAAFFTTIFLSPFVFFFCENYGLPANLLYETPFESRARKPHRREIFSSF
jgi:hypothetical protein